MNPREYEIMAAVEAEHWWYRSLRQRLRGSLGRFGQHLPLRPSILDVGCGTGENLRYLRTCFQPRYLGGFDAEPIAVQYARQKNPQADIYLSDLCAPELHDDSYDVVFSCDVLYIPGLEASLAGLASIVQSMSSGGLLLLNLPAYNWLRSDHDLAIATRQRVVARQVRELMGNVGLKTVGLTYRVHALLPLVIASRLPSMLRPTREADRARSALKPPTRLANFVFGSVMAIENRLIDAGCQLPWGSSVFAVGKKA